MINLFMVMFRQLKALGCEHRWVHLLGISAWRTSDGAIVPAAGSSAGTQPWLMFHSFNPRTSQGGGAAAGMSPYRPLHPVLGSLLSLRLVLSMEPKPEAPLFCLPFENLPQLGACDPKRLQEPLAGCSSVASATNFHWIGEHPVSTQLPALCTFPSFSLPMEQSIQP